MNKRNIKIYSLCIVFFILLTPMSLNAVSSNDEDTSNMIENKNSCSTNFKNNLIQLVSEKISSILEHIKTLKIKQSPLKNDGEVYEGYTLFSPMWDTKTYLIDNEGSVLKTWSSIYTDCQGSYLLENGNLLRTSLVAIDTLFSGGAQGRIEMINEDEEVIWSYEYASSTYNQHHDIEPLPNGNILLIAWELKTLDEAISQGKNPQNFRGNAMWPDSIIEIEPIGDSEINIVWEWRVWDHLIQDFDPTKENYGVISEHPELININYGSNQADWNHMNSIDYNEEFDQILVSVKMFNEIWIIDHSTTTEEAAGHSGGRYGKGGDLLYRWGNPEAYNQGTETDQKYFGQHSGTWVEEGYPGEGNILVFNNGGRDRQYASVDEIIPPINEQGFYQYTTDTAYGPKKQCWIYTAPNPKDLNSNTCSSVQRLPNGNTLICSSEKGYFLEVTMNDEIVWEYQNNYPIIGIKKNVPEVIKYPVDYPGIPETEEETNLDTTVRSNLT